MIYRCGQPHKDTRDDPQGQYPFGDADIRLIHRSKYAARTAVPVEQAQERPGERDRRRTT